MVRCTVLRAREGKKRVRSGSDCTIMVTLMGKLMGIEVRGIYAAVW